MNIVSFLILSVLCACTISWHVSLVYQAQSEYFMHIKKILKNLQKTEANEEEGAVVWVIILIFNQLIKQFSVKYRLIFMVGAIANCNHIEWLNSC